MDWIRVNGGKARRLVLRCCSTTAASEPEACLRGCAWRRLPMSSRSPLDSWRCVGDFRETDGNVVSHSLFVLPFNKTIVTRIGKHEQRVESINRVVSWMGELLIPLSVFLQTLEALQLFHASDSKCSRIRKRRRYFGRVKTSQSDANQSGFFRCAANVTFIWNLFSFLTSSQE